MDNDVKIDKAQLKNLRNSRGWTQQHLAEISDLSLRTVSRAEKSGIVSQESISALSAVFEVERGSWLVQPENYFESLQFKTRAWTIALISMLAFQCFAGVGTYLLFSEIPTIWIKLILLLDGLVVLFLAVLYFTGRIHKR